MQSVEPAVAYYNRNAASFDDSYERDSNRLERVRVWRDVLDRYVPHANLAYDMGCGSGRLTLELAARAGSVVGIDGSQAMLDIASKTAEERGIRNVRFLERTLPLEEAGNLEPADAVIASSSIEYLDSMDAALESIRRLLVPSGILIFSVSNRHSLSRHMVRIVHRITGRPRYFGLVKQFLSAEDCKGLLATCGFDYVQHSYFGGRDRLNRTLAMLFPLAMSTNMIMVVARRRD